MLTYPNSLSKIECLTDSEVNISEQFERQTVTVLLEWTQNDPRIRALHSYYVIVSVTPLTQSILKFNETSSVVVNMYYNIVYNLTVLISGNSCLEIITLISQSFYYCEYLMAISSRFYL